MPAVRSDLSPSSLTCSPYRRTTRHLFPPHPCCAFATEPFIAGLKAALGEVVSDVRASDRLTESAVCLVAPESGMDRQLERLLARAGQLPSAAKPILEINPRHDLIIALARLDDEEQSLCDDVAHPLLDEARILDGELPADAKAFSQRLARVMRRSAP
ncbi:hypothetical protein U0023_32600 (plasmid) [Microvirga lotononidis]|uniref:hypothetical protein n=1 Tax=Microvirga lotononidis TaxID=864069 RepID=UPI000A001B28|nr:hypothetical protein U0023_32600 [Microvirga lotononidis]